MAHVTQIKYFGWERKHLILPSSITASYLILHLLPPFLPSFTHTFLEANHLLKLLLGTQLVRVPAFAFAAIGRSGGETGLFTTTHRVYISSSSVSSRMSGKGTEMEGGEGGGRGKTYITFPTNHLLAIVFAGEGFEGGFDDAAAETEDEVEG